jgi:hypothetical protein
MKADDKDDLAPLLLMTVRQLEAAMQDAAAEAELLSRAVASLGERGATMRDTGGASTHAKALPILADAQRAMRALQFHDRLSQRVAHVRDALACLHGGVAAGADGDWSSVRESIRRLYTMEDERRLFDAMVLQDGAAGIHEPGVDGAGHPAGVELF